MTKLEGCLFFILPNPGRNCEVSERCSEDHPEDEEEVDRRPWKSFMIWAEAEEEEEEEEVTEEAERREEAIA